MRAIPAAHVEDTDNSRPSERFTNYLAHETQALRIPPDVFDLAGELFCHGLFCERSALQSREQVSEFINARCKYQQRIVTRAATKVRRHQNENQRIAHRRIDRSRARAPNWNQR